MKTLSRRKAKKILKEGWVNSHPLSKKQRGLFGLITSGKKRKKKY